MERLLPITKALADGNRVRILMALRGGELCVCQLIALLGLAPSTVSKHVSILRRAGLVESRKEGRWIFCRHAGGVADTEAPLVVVEAMNWMASHLDGDPQIEADVERLKGILKTDRDELCRVVLRS